MAGTADWEKVRPSWEEDKTKALCRGRDKTSTVMILRTQSSTAKTQRLTESDGGVGVLEVQL